MVVIADLARRGRVAGMAWGRLVGTAWDKGLGMVGEAAGMEPLLGLGDASLCHTVATRTFIAWCGLPL